MQQTDKEISIDPVKFTNANEQPCYVQLPSALTRNLKPFLILVQSKYSTSFKMLFELSATLCLSCSLQDNTTDSQHPTPPNATCDFMFRGRFPFLSESDIKVLEHATEAATCKQKSESGRKKPFCLIEEAKIVHEIRTCYMQIERGSSIRCNRKARSSVLQR